MAKVTKKAVKRVRFYGLVKPKSGQKMSWLSQQNKHGWSLGLALGKRTIWLRNVRFASVGDVEKALKAGTVLVHLKG